MYKCGCPGCKRQINLKEGLFGRKLKCKCGRVFRAPQKPEHPPEVIEAAIVEESFSDPLGLPASDFPSSQQNSPAKFETRYNRPEKFKNKIKEKPAPRKNPHKSVLVPSQGNTSFFDGPVIGGMAMMLIAVVWFIGGLQFGYIYFYPPVLFVLGFISVIKGLFNPF